MLRPAQPRDHRTPAASPNGPAPQPTTSRTPPQGEALDPLSVKHCDASSSMCLLPALRYSLIGPPKTLPKQSANSVSRAPPTPGGGGPRAVKLVGRPAALHGVELPEHSGPSREFVGHQRNSCVGVFTMHAPQVAAEGAVKHVMTSAVVFHRIDISQERSFAQAPGCALPSTLLPAVPLSLGSCRTPTPLRLPKSD